MGITEGSLQIKINELQEEVNKLNIKIDELQYNQNQEIRNKINQIRYEEKDDIKKIIDNGIKEKLSIAEKELTTELKIKLDSHLLLQKDLWNLNMEKIEKNLIYLTNEIGFYFYILNSKFKMSIEEIENMFLAFSKDEIANQRMSNIINSFIYRDFKLSINSIKCKIKRLEETKNGTN